MQPEILPQPSAPSQPPLPPAPPVPQQQPPQRWRPSFRAVRALVMLGLVVIVLAIIGVRSLFRDSSDTQSSSQATTNATAVCTDGKQLAAAPAYQAHTDQPLALYARSNYDAGVHYQAVYVLGTAPLSSPLHDAYTGVGKNLSATLSAKQTPVLVACITRSQEKLTDQVCSYSGGKTVPVYAATYHLTVYEARNHRAVVSVDVPTAEQYTCASYTAYDGKGFYRAWDPASVAQALYPLIK